MHLKVYLDHNATSPATASHLADLFEIINQGLGNPSSPHEIGRNSSVALTKTRKLLAKALEVDEGTLIFTSGATESNNMAIMGVCRPLLANYGFTPHAITSSFEHASVLEPLEFLQRSSNLNISFINPCHNGFTNLENFLKSITPQTIFLSLMVANNEVGTLQPVKDLGDVLHYKRWGIVPNGCNREQLDEQSKHIPGEISSEMLQKIHFHVDAVQAFGKIPTAYWNSPGIDSFSVSGHKIGALSGVGALHLKKGRKLEHLLLGGAQEKNRRAGTENIAGIVSFGLACQELLSPEWQNRILKMNNLRMELYNTLSNIPNIILNSTSTNSLPNTINISIAGNKHDNNLQTFNGEDLLLELDLKGFYASSGSACSSGANKPSHVLKAMGRSNQQAQNAIRFSLSVNTQEEDIKKLIDFLNSFI